MRLGFILALVATLTATTTAVAQKSASLGSNPPGTAFYSVASGLSKIGSKLTASRRLVAPVPVEKLS